MVAHYDGYSHDELYAMVKAGHPEQVDAVAAIWNSLATTADDFARDLERDLGRLGPYWSGAAGIEYARRVASMARFSRDISTETGVVGSRLGILAQLLRETQAKIENPADTDDHDKTASYAATGAKVGGTVLGPGGAIVGTAAGGIAGWFADDDEAEKAKVRTVKLVQELAAGYEVEGPPRHVIEPVVPAELPTGVNGNVARAHGAAVGTVSAYAGLHGGGTQHVVAHATAPGVVARPGETHTGVVPHTSADGSSGAIGVGSGLAGVGDGGFVGVAAGESHQRGGFSNGVVRGPLDGLGGAGSNGTAVAGAAGVVNGTGLAGSSSAQQGGVARPEGLGARPGMQPGPHLTPGRTAGQVDDDTDERLTWLTEDDMDWGLGS
jgi:uncharacterized protein YukE